MSYNNYTEEDLDELAGLQALLLEIRDSKNSNFSSQNVENIANKMMPSIIRSVRDFLDIDIKRMSKKNSPPNSLVNPGDDTNTGFQNAHVNNNGDIELHGGSLDFNNTDENSLSNGDGKQENTNNENLDAVGSADDMEQEDNQNIDAAEDAPLTDVMKDALEAIKQKIIAVQCTRKPDSITIYICDHVTNQYNQKFSEENLTNTDFSEQFVVRELILCAIDYKIAELKKRIAYLNKAGNENRNFGVGRKIVKESESVEKQIKDLRNLRTWFRGTRYDRGIRKSHKKVANNYDYPKLLNKLKTAHVFIIIGEPEHIFGTTEASKESLMTDISGKLADKKVASERHFKRKIRKNLKNDYAEGLDSTQRQNFVDKMAQGYNNRILSDYIDLETLDLKTIVENEEVKERLMTSQIVRRLKKVNLDKQKNKYFADVLSSKHRKELKNNLKLFIKYLQKYERIAIDSLKVRATSYNLRIKFKVYSHKAGMLVDYNNDQEIGKPMSTSNRNNTEENSLDDNLPVEQVQMVENLDNDQPSLEDNE